MSRVYFNILIYLMPGEEATFRAYEAQAMPRLAKYGGRVECMFTPDHVTDGFELPDEIHVLSFADEAGFAAYRQDPVVQQAASLREASVAQAIFLRGKALVYEEN